MSTALIFFSPLARRRRRCQQSLWLEHEFNNEFQPNSTHLVSRQACVSLHLHTIPEATLEAAALGGAAPHAARKPVYFSLYLSSSRF